MEMAVALRSHPEGLRALRSVLLVAKAALRGDQVAVNGASLGLLNAESIGRIEAAAADYQAGALTLRRLFGDGWEEFAARLDIVPEQGNGYLVTLVSG